EMPTAAPYEHLEKVLERLGPDLRHRVLVFDAGQLIGILSPSDVARLVGTLRTTADRRPDLTARPR
ncbi:MAG: CBS domain-containing protein, partial [Candidatus Dormibacteraeota bacterium]|nr:CBS domain-containing protein [Candidatus Dormibacteraeota bacterium]